MADVKTPTTSVDLTSQEIDILSRIRDLRNGGAHRLITITRGKEPGSLLLDIRFDMPLAAGGDIAITSLRVALDGEN